MTIQELESAHKAWALGIEILGNEHEFKTWLEKSYPDPKSINADQVYDDIMRLAHGYPL